jgi:hypothetical protein
MDKINYAEKISNFNLIVGEQNQDIAYKYLSQCGWDETKAAQLFNEDSKKMEKAISRYLQLQERKQKMKPKYIEKYQEYKIDSINSIINKITSYFKEDNTKYFHRYSKIKNAVRLLDDFISQLKTDSKTGIIILYSSNHMKLIREQLKNIINEPLSKELFLDNTILYPVIDQSLEGNNFINELNCDKLPLFIICKYKNEESLAIIGKIEIPFNLSDFRDKILESELVYYNKDNVTQVKNNNNNSSSINNINEENKNSGISSENNRREYIPDYRDYEFEDEFGIDFKNIPENNIKMTDGQVLAFQELKLRELEKIEEKKQIEEKKLLEEEENMKNIIDKEIEESKKIAVTLKPEPEDDNPDKCIILFRFPDGDKTVQRKFLKHDKINLLYDFIKSLGRDIYTEKEHHHFSLLQTFPFKNFDDKKDNTLEQEGLFPNSVLQIKEIE